MLDSNWRSVTFLYFFQTKPFSRTSQGYRPDTTRSKMCFLPKVWVLKRMIHAFDGPYNPLPLVCVYIYILPLKWERVMCRSQVYEYKRSWTFSSPSSSWKVIMAGTEPLRNIGLEVLSTQLIPMTSIYAHLEHAFPLLFQVLSTSWLISIKAYMCSHLCFSKTK